MPHQLEAPVVAQRRLDEAEYEVILRAPAIAAQAAPGQFVQLRLGAGYEPLARRPFSVFWVDPDQGTFAIVFLARGAFTQRLARCVPGDLVSVVGPLGSAFVPAAAGTHHVLVGGGVGAPPLYFLASRLADWAPECVTVINGARSRGLLVAQTEFAALDIDLRFATEDGSLGTRGLVTDVLRTLLEARAGEFQVYACGPTAMLRAVASLCARVSVPCQVSVETLMPCGVGVCMGCVLKVRDTSAPEGFVYLRSCVDGPVFDAASVIWEDV